MSSQGTAPLVGAWRMTSLEVGTEGNLEPVPYSGQIVFTKSGTMSVQAMNPEPDAPDTPYTLNGYEAFYGTVSVDRSAGTFAVNVESSLVRDLIGQRLTRVFEVSGDTLVLTPPDPAEGWRATYERI
ncbi:lipocalin-like domain-containing protein [Actinopolymorpha sp. B9G3]|uniref:lipocalin-like domain-containing protein n=1 Tax=Actinopolymorpha sp. B9G3 TaxID=3158970 RepID=UPI0032D8E550